jgi:16S rRNA (cytosine967-C5)-methyltransferase
MSATKVHRHLIESLAPTLREIFQSQSSIESVLERTFKAHRKWGSRDRKFFAEQIYELIRWWRKLWFLLGAEPDFEPSQIVRLWAIRLQLQNQELPAWEDLQNFQISPERLFEMQQDRSLRQSIPSWLDQVGSTEFGGQWDGILSSLNQAAPVDLRANTLLTDVSHLKQALASEEIETQLIADCESGLTLTTRKNFQNSKAFLAGLFEVQDRASQLVAPFLKVSPGQTVMDACAGAGGKSLHLAALMKNKGRLISCDVHDFKLKELKRRADRNQVKIIETLLIQQPEALKKFESTMDRLLLDVPCSGLGVLRRKPLDKWKLQPSDIEAIRTLQFQILKDYSRVTKPGGLMVYATCSFLPSENEAQVERFLKSQEGHWKLEDQIRVNPDQGRGDGFFAARLKRLA